MTRLTTGLLAVSLLLGGCDLPTSADEARERLGRDQEERIVPIQLPMPELAVTLAEQLGELSEIVDTTDLSFNVDPDTFTVSLDSLLAIDPVDPDPVVQGYDIVVADFTRDINVTLPAVPLTLPSNSAMLLLAPSGGGTLPAIPVDLSATFTDATFATGSALDIALTTDAASTIDNVSAVVQTTGGAQLASSTGTVTLGTSSTDTLTVDLSGVTLPGSFELVLSFASSTGDAGGDELTVDMAFSNAEVESASGVDAGTITPVSFTETVALDQTGSDFSEATLAAGTATVTSFTSGDLELAPDFNGDLSGLQVGGATPDNLDVGGEVGPPTGATTVDVTNTASLTVAFTGLDVQSVTLNQVTVDVDQTVALTGTGETLDDLEEVTVESGSLQVDIANRLGIAGTVTLTLAGVVDASGAVVTQDIQVQPSLDGSARVTSATVDLADAVITPAILEPRVAGTISASDVTVTPAAAAEAVSVDPLLDIEPREVVLSALPADQQVTLDERVPIGTSDIELDELGDLLDKIDFNDITFTVSLDNTTGLDMQVDSFRMTLLDGSGQAVQSGGDTARVELSNDPSGMVLIPANTKTVVEGQANQFVNQLLDEIAAGRDVEVAASGVAGPAADSGSVSLGDALTVVFLIELGPDITIDPDGVVFDHVVAEALDLDSIASEFLSDLSEDLVSAEVEFQAVNGMPLGMSVRMALAPTPVDTTDFDPLNATPNIALPEFTVEPAAVDSDGKVSSPVTSEPSASVDPADFPVLAEGRLGLGLQAALLGPEGGRAVLQPTDSLVLRPLLKIEIRVNGSGGGTP